MWEQSPIQSTSGQAGQQPVSSVLSGQRESISRGQEAGPVAGGVPVQKSSGAQPGTSASYMSGASVADKMIRQRDIHKQQSAGELRQKRQEELHKTLEQFYQDNTLYSVICSAPMVRLPEKPKAEDYLNPATIRHILESPGFSMRVVSLDPDALTRFILQDFPADPREEYNRQFIEKAREYLKLDGRQPHTRLFLQSLYRDVRNVAASDADLAHQQTVLDICGQMRGWIQELEEEIRSEMINDPQQAARPSNTPETDSSASESAVPVVVPESEPSSDEKEESESEPTDTALPELPSVTEALAQDSALLYPLLQKQPGYYLVDGLPYKQFSLPQNVRNQLLSDELKERLSRKQNWGTGRYFELVPVEDTSCFGKLMKKAKFDPAVSREFFLGIALSGDSGRQVVQWTGQPEGSKKTSALRVTLSRVTAGDKKQTLALYNTDRSKSIQVYSGKQKKYVIKPKCGILLQPLAGKSKKSFDWTPVAEYRTGPVREEETNPLVRDFPKPVEAPGTGSRPLDKEGEYFLPPEMVSDLVALKRKNGQKPVVCYDTANVQQALKQAFGKGGEETGAVSLIFCDQKFNHIVAVRILRKNDEALVYIHETLDPASEVAEEIREEILNAARPFFKQSTLACVSPGFTSQVDFSSCGVFACKAIRAFDKQPELDEWLWEQGKQPGRVLHKANEYNRRLKLSDLSPCLIPLKEMNARLLKNYQGDEQFLSPDQLAAMVSHKEQLTLGEYLMDHQPCNAITDSYKANLSATGKRYKYLLQWQEHFLEKTVPGNVGLLQNMEATEDLLTPEEHQLITRFYPIIDAGGRDDVNKWLAVHIPDAAPVTESDWEISCMFEDFAFDSGELSQADTQALNKWVEQALDHPDDPHYQLVKAWCIYIKQSGRSRFRNRSLAEIQEALKAYIDTGLKPAGAVAGTKRSRSSSESSASSPLSKRPKQQLLLEDEPVGGKSKKEQRRERHNALELERRNVQRGSFSALSSLLEGKTKTKQQILNGAIDEIMQHVSQEAELTKLQKKKHRLELKLAKLVKERKKSLKATGSG